MYNILYRMVRRERMKNTLFEKENIEEIPALFQKIELEKPSKTILFYCRILFQTKTD